MIPGRLANPPKGAFKVYGRVTSKRGTSRLCIKKACLNISKVCKLCRETSTWDIWWRVDAILVGGSRKAGKGNECFSFFFIVLLLQWIYCLKCLFFKQQNIWLFIIYCLALLKVSKGFMFLGNIWRNVHTQSPSLSQNCKDWISFLSVGQSCNKLNVALWSCVYG